MTKFTVQSTCFSRLQMSNDDSPNWPMFKDIAGLDTMLHQLRNQAFPLLIGPNKHGKLDGILLQGPQGCRKTTLALAISNEVRLPFHKIPGPLEEEDIQALFSKARSATPSITLIDDIDTIAPKNLQEVKERRIVARLLTCIDESHQPVAGCIVVISTTNRPHAIHPQLTSTTRFNHVIPLGAPDRNARKQILTVLTRKLEISRKPLFRCRSKTVP